MTLSFLLIGIAWAELAVLVGEDKVEEMTKMVKAGISKDEARFTAAGLQYEFMVYGSDEGMGRLEDKLKESKYDGVCMCVLSSSSWIGLTAASGFGIRGTKDFTPLFERLVNTIHTASPSSKLLFNTSPDGTLDAARRQFPEIPAEQAA
jgi:hypothetical protein